MLASWDRRVARDDGSLAWTLGFIILALAIATALGVSAFVSFTVSQRATETLLRSTHQETVIADAIAVLNSGERLAASSSQAVTTCQVVSARDLCAQVWAVPSPLDAVEPTRYEMVSLVWVDGGDRTPPADGFETSTMVTALTSMSFQTQGDARPRIDGSMVVYEATPGGLFTNALTGLSRVQLAGDGTTVRSYSSLGRESASSDSGAVASSGFVTYGTGVTAGRTVLHGDRDNGGRDRCTGAACDVVDTTAGVYAPATDVTVEWARQASSSPLCRETLGDWVASEQTRPEIGPGLTCIRGSMIVDVPVTVTATSAAPAIVYVDGSVDIAAQLNAPAGLDLANPVVLQVYSLGREVSFAPVPDLTVAAAIYAPQATCGAGQGAQGLRFFGSLACDTISFDTPKAEFWYDDQLLTDLMDLAPEPGRVFSPGETVTVDHGHDPVPDGWTPSTCNVATPSGATAFWRLNEQRTGPARDQAGSYHLGWSGGFGQGLCDGGASVSPGGAVTGPSPQTTTGGMTLSAWVKGVDGTAASAAGLGFALDTTGHVTVTLGGADTRMPFTIQNRESWHLVTVTADRDGQVMLYVDGQPKVTADTGVELGSLSGAAQTAVIGSGTAGQVDEVVYWASERSAAQVSQAWAEWLTALPELVPTDPGTPVTAPVLTSVTPRDTSTGVTFDATWTPASGTLSPPAATATIQHRPSGGSSWTVNPVSLAQTDHTSAVLTYGRYDWRVCATYNGDDFCSNEVQAFQMGVPGSFRSTAQTTTSVTWAWNTVAGAGGYELEVNGTSVLVGSGVGTYTTTGLTQGEQATGRVRACTGTGADRECGLWSASVTATAKTIGTPGTPTVTNLTDTSGTATWTAAANAVSYQVEVTMTSNTGAVTTKTFTSSTATVSMTSLARAQQGAVRVRGLDASGQLGSWSAARSFSLTVPPPGAITFTGFTWNTSASRLDAQFSWVAAPVIQTGTGVASYQVLTSTDGGATWVHAAYPLNGARTVTLPVTDVRDRHIQVRAVERAGHLSSAATSPVLDVRPIIPSSHLRPYGGAQFTKYTGSVVSTCDAASLPDLKRGNGLLSGNTRYLAYVMGNGRFQVCDLSTKSGLARNSGGEGANRVDFQGTDGNMVLRTSANVAVSAATVHLQYTNPLPEQAVMHDNGVFGVHLLTGTTLFTSAWQCNNFFEQGYGHTPSGGCTRAVVGHADSATALSRTQLRVQGWAYDPDNVMPRNVQFRVDGTVVGTLAADQARQDVQNAQGIRQNRVGYNGIITWPFAPGSHQVCAFGQNWPGGEWEALTSSCRAVTVP